MGHLARCDAGDVARRLRLAIRELEADIQNAWHDVVAQAQEDETDPALRLSFAIKLNLGGNALVTSLSYSVRKKLEESGAIPDPNQPELPIEQEGGSD